MLWSIDSCQNRYPLTSVTWMYRGFKCTTHWGDVFIKVLRWTVMVLKWVQAQKALVQNDFLKVPSSSSLLALAKSTYNNITLYIYKHLGNTPMVLVLYSEFLTVWSRIPSRTLPWHGHLSIMESVPCPKDGKLHTIYTCNMDISL